MSHSVCVNDYTPIRFNQQSCMNLSVRGTSRDAKERERSMDAYLEDSANLGHPGRGTPRTAAMRWPSPKKAKEAQKEHNEKNRKSFFRYWV